MKYPETTVGALIINDKGEILLLKAHKWKNRYSIPGGHIEIGEKIENALKREEETNLDVDVIKLINIQEVIFSKEFYKPKHFIFLDYVCKAKSENVKLDKEAESYIWLKPENALKLDVEKFSLMMK